MNLSFWHERWERNEIGFHQTDINFYLQEFWPLLQLPKGQRVLVPLCGKSNDMLWLLEQGYLVLGVEISPVAVSAFFTENQLTPYTAPKGAFTSWFQAEIEILCGDYFALTKAELTGVTTVYDRASLIALPEAMRQRYAQQLTALLTPGMKVLLITLAYSSSEMIGPPFSVEEQEVYVLYQDNFEIKLLATKETLADNSKLAARGVTSLWESVYLLERR